MICRACYASVLLAHFAAFAIYPDIDKPGGSAATGIRADAFYGKRLGTAAREFLQMRKSSGEGPAKPRDIYEALVRGGLQFEAKDERTALVSLRATLRKSSSIFHKLPNGEYGLLAWYPNAKMPKVDDIVADYIDDEDDEGEDTEPVESEAADDDESSAA